MSVVVRKALRRMTAVAVCLLLSACSSHTPAPVTSVGKDYDSIKRGSYRGSYYEVQKGDTLYFISYVTGRDIKDIVAANKLSHPYTIFPGQKLQLWKPKYIAPAYGKAGTVPIVKPPVKTVVKANPPKAVPKPVPKPKPQAKPKPAKPVQKTAKKSVDPKRTKEYAQNTKSNKPVTKKTYSANSKVSGWTWPTKGRIIAKFSSAENGNKGIDIAGRRGQTVNASAGGVVVYAGNALRGYGNLVIIKHSEDYLSAYAHNEKVLVKEQQTVKAGQKIASMGSSGTSSVRLHFEIRYKGKSVNPLRYLPK